MKTVISTTYDDKYFYFLPLVTWAWNKIGVDVICFLPKPKNMAKVSFWENTISEMITDSRHILIIRTLNKLGLKCRMEYFDTLEHKEATYAQISRLYAACLDLPLDKVLITSDCDMLVFGEYLKQYDGNIQLFGADLLEGEKMYPMCYCSATVNQWRVLMNIGNDDTFQSKLDSDLGLIEAEHFRGNYWCFDQEKLYNAISNSILPITKHKRAKYPERFASHRYDRDDAYLLERLSLDTIDYHLPRPGYEDAAFNQILTVLKYHYPKEDFTWLVNYTNEYRNLI